MSNNVTHRTATFEVKSLVMVNMEERWRFTVPAGVSLTASDMEKHIEAHYSGEPFDGVTVEHIGESAFEYDHDSRCVHLPLGVQVLP